MGIAFDLFLLASLKNNFFVIKMEFINGTAAYLNILLWNYKNLWNLHADSYNSEINTKKEVMAASLWYWLQFCTNPVSRMSWQGCRCGRVPVTTEYNYLSIDFSVGNASDSRLEEHSRRRFITLIWVEQQDNCNHKHIYSYQFDYLYPLMQIVMPSYCSGIYIIFR